MSLDSRLCSLSIFNCGFPAGLRLWKKLASLTSFRSEVSGVSLQEGTGRDLWWVPTGTRVCVCTLHSYRGVGLGINRASPSVTELDRTCP